ncbi:MAG: ABC transporter ATP-binding protein [Syntrophorhabdales bacterium]|jgi:branched-chain amino acid transport system ATP-binding protein
MELLRVSDISLNLEGIQILSKGNMIIEEGSIHAVIGPNGAGKTSLMNCITGYYNPNEGSIFYKGKEITHLKPHSVARLGISRMFQHIEIIRSLSVRDNVLLGRHMHLDYNLLQGLLYYGKAHREEARNREEIREIMSFLQLDGLEEQIAGSLPYGTQKRVELARAIAGRPQMLILDEPTSGMNQQEKEEIIHAVLRVHQSFIPTIILIEHDMRVVMKISERISVMNFGTVIAEGGPKEIQQNDLVIEAYLGTE